MRASSAIFAVAALFCQASATIYVTQPVASTVCAAGSECTLAWNDDGTTPALGTIGPCSIDLCTGGVQQQTCLQNISPSTDVSQVASINYTPNPSIGASGDVWFLKFTSLSYKDPANPTFPFTAFSAKVTLSGMTGTFNATVQSEINGASAAVVATTSASAAPMMTTSAAAVMTTAKATTTGAVAAKTTTSSTAKATGSTSGALNVVSSFAGVTIAAGLVGLAAFGF